ncbi:DUF3071 domain-containing protein [Cutibacterium sp. WCA-380-WT-3A]|uniref:DUF3071 domain-containing protein n=1 Tax=Cutibacterium porci TaxID=2605781 RepID=A0A7K0J6Z1_9ACTN|nr:DUF3071 domain-containing protein [Cutibacterium porci]
MDSALSPREIQSRIRSGATVEEVAAEAGVGVDQVEPFAVPVLAELDHIIEVAMTCPVRRAGAPGSHRTLGTVIARVAKANSIPDEKIAWRSWRHEDRTWALEAHWPASEEGAPDAATFRFDLKGRHTSPEDAGARWLVNDRSPAPAEPLPEGAPDPDQEPTLDLNDELAIVRAVSNRQRHSSDPETVAGMTKHDGVYDFDSSSPADMDMLYEMLAGFQEDSVNIYEGLDTPVLDAPSSSDASQSPEPTEDASHDDEKPKKTGEDQSPVPSRPATDSPSSTRQATTSAPRTKTSLAHADTDTPQQDALVEEGERPRKKRKPRKSKRASIPSWDEIMFGGPTPHA